MCAAGVGDECWVTVVMCAADGDVGCAETMLEPYMYVCLTSLFKG